MIGNFVFSWLYNFLWRVVRPSYWALEGPISQEFDKELIALLKDGTSFKDIGTFTAKFGPYVLWIENHPYASFSCRKTKVLPSARVRKLLMERLSKSYF